MKTKKIDLDKLTQEIIEVMLSSSDIFFKREFIKRQLTIAHLSGRVQILGEMSKKK